MPHKRVVFLLLVLLYTGAYAQCPPSSGSATNLDEDVLEPAGIITFDNYGFSGTFGWDSDVTENYTLVQTETQQIVVFGQSCVIYKSSFGMSNGGWQGNTPWPGSTDTPGYYLGTNNGYCILQFVPPIHQISMWSSSESDGAQFHIQDANEDTISCRIVPDVNTGANNYSTLGFSSDTPITFIYLGNNYAVADNIAWSPCKLGFAYRDGGCVDLNPVTQPVDAPVDAPVAAPSASPAANPMAGTPVKAPSGKASFGVASVAVSSVLSAACVLLSVSW